MFTQFLLERLPRLDYLLNNACQTVRRPAGFFEHLLAREDVPLAALPDAWRGPLASREELRRRVEGSQTPTPGALIAARSLQGEGLLHSAALSQRRYLDEDYQSGEALFPADRYDEDLQQVDLREVNSWRLRMHEVKTPELLEVQLVNAIAPYVLNARLKPLMLRTPGSPQACGERERRRGSILSKHQDRQASAHQHGESGAQHDDAHQRAGLCQRRHPHERGRHRMGDGRRPGRACGAQG